MRKYVIAAVLIVGFAAPAMPAETVYVIFDTTLEGCTITTTMPADKIRYKVLGEYKSNDDARLALHGMKEC
jgi:hypothetical protein